MMSDEKQKRLKERYLAAVDSFVDKVRDDPNVIAVVIVGSLSYDVVWEKSDIDVILIIRDQPLKTYEYCIIEDGITFSVELAPRNGFKRYIERSLGGSFSQSLFSEAKLVYTRDESLYEYFDELKIIGADDISLSAFNNALSLTYYCEKCEKWLKARKDPQYAQYFLLLAAESIAQMELCIQGLPFRRDGIRKALELAPELLKPFYQDAMTHLYSEDEILSAIDRIYTYLEQHLDLLKEPVMDYLSDHEIKTVTMINKHFHVSSDSVILFFDFLAERGIIEKVSKTIRITPKSKPSAEEIGYMLIPEFGQK